MNYIYLCYLIVSLIGVYGLAWLTKFAFHAQYAVTSIPKIGLNGAVACVMGIDGTKLLFAKITTVCLWVQMGFLCIYTLYLMFSGKKC